MLDAARILNLASTWLAQSLIRYDAPASPVGLDVPKIPSKTSLSPSSSTTPASTPSQGLVRHGEAASNRLTVILLKASSLCSMAASPGAGGRGRRMARSASSS